MRIIAYFLIALLSFQSVFADFSDVQYSWYRSSIIGLQKAWIVNGQSDGSYKPDWLITRAEMLKIIMGAAKTPLLTNSEQCFPDVDRAKWYSAYICAAQKAGITKGFSDGTFRPNETVTDLEALAFGFRAFGIVPTLTEWKNWYDSYRDFANKNNILATHSYTLGTKITRGKAAELIVNIAQYRKSQAPLSYGSLGCTASGAVLQIKNTIMIDWVSREYNLSIPNGYSKNKQYNLVVAIHGRTNSNDMVQGYMGLQSKAGWGRTNNGGTSQLDSIIAYPAWVKVSGGYSWSDASNVVFFDAILKQVSDNYCVNRDQVFVIGHSLGGWFANKLACVRGDVINGMTSVGGPGYSGSCAGPVASLLFQNVNDPLVPLASWKYAEATRKSVNECSNTSTPIMIGPFQCKQWNDCSTGNPVTWCEWYPTYQNDPHGWPIGGGTAILNFFRSL